MVKSPCRDLVEFKKGPWTPDEDQKLLAYVEQHGQGRWRALPAKAGLQRCGKSCRLRWINYLRPDIKRGKFSLQEEQTIVQLHALLGNRWSVIAAYLPKRTDNEIKNHWNTNIKKRLTKMGIDPVTHKPKTDAPAIRGGGGNSRDAANLSHMAQWESTRLEAEARHARESRLVNCSPIQPQRGSSVSARFVNKAMASVPPARPQCLDILKAWQGVVSGMFAMACDDLESPTSTLDFSKATVPVPIMEDDKFSTTSIPDDRRMMINEGDEEAGKCLENTKPLEELKEILDDSLELHDMYSMTNSIGGTGFQEFPATENMVEGISDIFDFDFDDKSSSMAGKNSGNEERRSYCWNSVMNLTNGSLSGLPSF